MTVHSRSPAERDPVASDLLSEVSTVLQAASDGIVERVIGQSAVVRPAPVVEALERAGDVRVLPEIPEAVTGLAVEALRWMKAGYPVLPVVVEPNDSPNSHSAWKKRPGTKAGVDDATTDAVDLAWRLRETVRRYPPGPNRSYALGIAWAGSHPQGGFLVSVDVDDQKVFDAHERRLGRLPASHLIRTQSGGRAYVGRSRSSHPTQTRFSGQAGVEWRQERAYSVVAGETPDGRRWRAEFDPALPPPFFPDRWQEAAVVTSTTEGEADPYPVDAPPHRRASRAVPPPRPPSAIADTHAEARAIAADLLQAPLLGPDGEAIGVKARGLRRSRKGLATWLRCAPNGETLKASATRHLQVFHAGIFAGQLARDEGLPPMEALDILLASRGWHALAAEPSDRSHASRAVDEIRTFIDGIRTGAKMPRRPRAPDGLGEVVELAPDQRNVAASPERVDPTAAVLAVVAAVAAGAVPLYPAPSSVFPVVSGFHAPTWAAASASPSLRDAASLVHGRLGRPTILRAHSPATEVVSALVDTDLPCTVVSARRLLHSAIRRAVPGLHDLSDPDAVRGRGDDRRVVADRASLTVHAVARRKVPERPGLLVVADAALVARAVAEMRDRGLAALRVLRAHVIAGWGVVLADPHIDAETAHELLVALGADLGHSVWLDIQRPPTFAAVDWLLAPTGTGSAGVSAHVHGIQHALRLIDRGDPVLLAVSSASNIDEFGRVRRLLADARPGASVAVLDGNADPEVVELAETADVVLASPAAFGLTLQRPRHLIGLPAACPGLGAVDARRLLDLIHEPLSVSVAATYGGAGPIVDAAASAACHARARAHTRAFAGGHLPAGPDVNVPLTRVLGRLRESLRAVSWRHGNVHEGLLGLLSAGGIEVRFVARGADEALLDLGDRLRAARQQGEQARAVSISMAPDIGDEDAGRLRALPRWRLCREERLALDKRELQVFYPPVVWDPEARTFRSGSTATVCPELVHRDQRGRHRVRATRFVVADLVARGEIAAALTKARGELQDDGSTAEYLVEGATVALGILTKLTRSPADVRLEAGLANWLAGLEWASDDPELRAAMNTPEMAVLLHRAVVALRATWTPSSSVAQVVGDLLERLGVATTSTRPKRRARIYMVDLASVREVDLLGSAERERMRTAAARLVADLRPGVDVRTDHDAPAQQVRTASPRRAAAAGPPG